VYLWGGDRKNNLKNRFRVRSRARGKKYLPARPRLLERSTAPQILIAAGKNSRSFCFSVGDEEKKCFINLTPGVNVIKLFSFVTDDEAQ